MVHRGALRPEARVERPPAPLQPMLRRRPRPGREGSMARFCAMARRGLRTEAQHSSEARSARPSRVGAHRGMARTPRASKSSVKGPMRDVWAVEPSESSDHSPQLHLREQGDGESAVMEGEAGLHVSASDSSLEEDGVSAAVPSWSKDASVCSDDECSVDPDEGRGLPTKEALRQWLLSDAALLLEIMGTFVLCACFALESLPLRGLEQDVLQALELDTSVFFAVLYLMRWYVNDLNPGFLLTPFMMVDLISLLPLAFGDDELRAGAFLRVLRILRISRVLQEEELSRLVSLLLRKRVTVKGSQLVVTQVFFTLFSFIFITAGVVYELEHPVDPEHFNTFFDALYFSITTLTSTGFGDIVPVTAAGRAVTSVAILAYAILIPYELAVLAQSMGIMDGNNRKMQPDTTCSGCGESSHEVDANFCRVCGASLPVGVHTEGESEASGRYSPIGPPARRRANGEKSK